MSIKWKIKPVDIYVTLIYDKYVLLLRATESKDSMKSGNPVKEGAKLSDNIEQ